MLQMILRSLQRQVAMSLESKSEHLQVAIGLESVKKVGKLHVLLVPHATGGLFERQASRDKLAIKVLILVSAARLGWLQVASAKAPLGSNACSMEQVQGCSEVGVHGTGRCGRKTVYGGANAAKRWLHMQESTQPKSVLSCSRTENNGSRWPNQETARQDQCHDG